MAGILVLAVVLAVGILTTSGKSTEKKWRQRRARDEQSRPGSRAEHEWVDNEPGGGAWVLALIVIIALCIVAVHVG